MNRKHVMMESQFQLFKVKPSATDSGFTLVECLVAFVIISIQFLLFYSAFDLPTDRIQMYLFKNEFAFQQSLCLKNQSGYYFDTSSYSVSYGYPINFNSNGHINMAQTLYFNRNTLIIELGNGVLLEK